MVTTKDQEPLRQDGPLKERLSNWLTLVHRGQVVDAYRTFLGLASHEYFHSWNVKRIKPAAFMPYDLARENYTRQLWAFEGITSYYDDLALAFGKKGIQAMIIEGAIPEIEREAKTLVEASRRDQGLDHLGFGDDLDDLPLHEEMATLASGRDPEIRVSGLTFEAIAADAVRYA